MKTTSRLICSLLIIVCCQSAVAETGDSYDDFYRSDEVQSIYLRMTEKDRQSMLAALPERIYVPVSFRWRDVSIDNAVVRFKGNSSSSPNQQHKRSFLIKFDENDEDRRFCGLRRVSFDNGVQFGSVFSEPIMTDVLRDLGVTTHRANYAKVYLNDEYRGVYVNVERIDESFIERHLPDATGALFKVDEGGPGCNLQFLGDNPSVYKKAFEAKNDSAKKGRDRLVEFIRMINHADQRDFALKLESKMLVEDFLRVSAVMLLSGAFDQLTGWNPHNYYLYHDANDDRWRYLPWDLDVGFSETAFGRIHVLADWNAAWPVVPNGSANPLMERIIGDPTLLKRYRSVAQMILNKYFEPERLSKAIDAKYNLIKEDLKADPFAHRRVTNPNDRSYEDIVELIKKFVRKRYASAVEQLENPGTRPKIVRRPEGRRPGNRPAGMTPQFAAKIRQVEQRAGKMRQNGQDISPIQRVMSRLGPLMQQGKLEEAEKVIDEALAAKLSSPDLPFNGASPAVRRRDGSVVRPRGERAGVAR